MNEQLTFLHGSHYPDCRATVDKTFTYHTLQFMVQGEVELFYDEQRHLLQQRWLWPCYPGPWVRFHAGKPGGWWNHRYIAFTGPLVMQWQRAGLWVHEPEPVAAGDGRGLMRLFDAMLEETRRPGKWARLRAINLLEQILLQRAELRQARQPDEPDWLASVLTMLSQVRGEPDYAQLAKKHGMSLTTLRRRFRQYTGQSLHEHHLGCRITQARQLLGETELPIKALADQLGYRDIYYFNRQFARHVGVPPGAYRKSRQK